MSELIRLFNSPTRFCEKNDMGSFTKLLYNETLRFARVFSVKLTNKDNLKKEKIDCKNKITIKPPAIILACVLSLFLTQSISIPISFGKARAVAPVNSKKIKPT